MNDERRERRPIPTLLSKSDAMLHAAAQLEEQLSNLELVNILKEVMEKPGFTDELDEKGKTGLEDLRVLGSGIKDIDLQRKAMKDAVSEIRNMAHEVKLTEARAAAHGISEPTVGGR